MRGFSCSRFPDIEWCQMMLIILVMKSTLMVSLWWTYIFFGGIGIFWVNIWMQTTRRFFCLTIKAHFISIKKGQKHLWEFSELTKCWKDFSYFSLKEEKSRHRFSSQKKTLNLPEMWLAASLTTIYNLTIVCIPDKSCYWSCMPYGS